MSIRLKIILIVAPLIIATLVLTGVSSYFSASNGITRIARDFLGFKADELARQAQSQWGLLVDNGLTDRPEMVGATQAAVQAYARGIIRSATELILTVTADGAIVGSTTEVSYRDGEREAIAALARSRTTQLVTVSIGGFPRVAEGFWFEPFGWYVLVTEERAAFYGPITTIAIRTAIILAGSLIAAIVLVLVFVRYLTRPIMRVVATMKTIISTSDLTQRVVVEYHDEIGQLAQTFNLMIGGLHEAYRQIKGFAFQAVVAQRMEKRTQTLFGKFVPEQVIHEVFANPEDTLIGDNRRLTVLFSDIRSFTTISESMQPAELVHALNRYFDTMVAIIMKRDGIVDKYIGDAIKAFFGAQHKDGRTDFLLPSVMAGIEMIEALDDFNIGQRAAGLHEFHIGVGLNYGLVTIGNIGTEKKKEYTVIGDMVELAETFEGLTKTYHNPLILSESLHEAVKDAVPCRLLDWIPAGPEGAMRIYTTRRSVSGPVKEAWELHNQCMEDYRARRFNRAAAGFRDVQRLLPGDECAEMLIERCERLAKASLPETWDGVDVQKAS
ncbi:MAG TPA: adenylate/guanylate cyclase domain-containing protein [Spirochaetia bacterium]